MAERGVQLLQLGPQVLPRGLPGHAGHAGRAPHADRLPRQRRRDGQGPPDDRGRGRGLRALHHVRCLRASLPQHALHRRLLPLPPADGGRGQGDARARGQGGHPPGELEAVGRAHRPLGQRARSRLEHRDLCGQGAGLGDRPRHPHRAARRSSSPTARLPSTAPRCRVPWRSSCRRPVSSSGS